MSWFGLCVLLVGMLMPPAVTAAVKVVLRYDDYSSFQSDPRIIAFEQALFEGVQALGGHLIVGVIPFPGMPHPDSESAALHAVLPLGDDKLKLLKRYVEAGTVTVALHGYNHGDNRTIAGTASEFAGLPQAKQELLLRSAKRALRDATGLEASTFVPPFNQYDSATLRALDVAGFHFLSAGRRTLVAESPVGEEFRFLPGTVHPRLIKQAATAGLASGTGDALIVVTLHPYDFADTGMPMPGFRSDAALRLDQWLEELRSVAEMEGVRFVSPQQLSDAGEDLSWERLEANSSIRHGFVARRRLLPEWAGLYPPDGVYMGKEVANAVRIQQFVTVAVTVVVGLVVTWFPTHTALRRFGTARPWLRRVPLVLGLIGLVAVGVYSSVAGFFLSGLILLAISVGLLFGAMAGAHRDRPLVARADDAGAV